MSWMDSWSRPSKSQATPAPFYLLPGGDSTPYCHSCGRVIGARRTGQSNAANATPVKYCSSRCRSHKPGKVDREVEAAFVRLLIGDEAEAAMKEHKGKSPKGKGKKRQKGDQRRLVSCGEVEKTMFGHGDEGQDSDNANSGNEGEHENTNAAENQPIFPTIYDTDQSGGSLEDPVADAAPHVDGDVLARMSVRSGTRKRPPQSVSEVNGSVGGEKGRAERIEETDEMLEKRRRGQRRAKEREMVRCAARRGVAFGFLISPGGDGSEKQVQAKDGGEDRRKCEAVMLGKVVEPSFAKGDWAIRWRG